MKALKTSIPSARFDEARFDPETVPTVRALQPVPAFHLLQSGPEVVLRSSPHKAVERSNSGWAAHEELQSARIANDVRLVFLRDFDSARSRTYGTGKHLFFVEKSHCQFLRVTRTASVCAAIV